MLRNLEEIQLSAIARCIKLQRRTEASGISKIKLLKFAKRFWKALVILVLVITYFSYGEKFRRDTAVGDGTCYEIDEKSRSIRGIKDLILEIC